jgi:SAM-dependent methyltransferase
MTLAPTDRARFSTIAHGQRRILSPLSETKAVGLLQSLTHGLGPDDTLLDAGCGKAALLQDALGLAPLRGVGVDIDAQALALAQTRLSADARLDGRWQLLQVPLLEHQPPSTGYAAIVCVGSTHAFGGYQDCLRTSWHWLKPGGRLLVGEAYWKQTPSPAYLARLRASADDYTSHADNAQRACDGGYALLRSATSSDDEWDAYEGDYCSAMMQHLAAHPDDPAHAAFLARIQSWHQAYLHWGRDTLGFGFYLLTRP